MLIFLSVDVFAQEIDQNTVSYNVEVGGMGANNGSVYYASNAKKIRSKEGVLYKLSAGNKIGLIDYTDTTLLLYITVDGKDFSTKKLLSGYYTATEDVYIAFTINSSIVQKNTDLIYILNFLPSIIGDSYEITIDKLRSMQQEIRPSFAIIDDDGHEVVYKYLYPWALSNNVPFTDALLAQKVSASKGTSFLTVSQVQEMYESGIVTFGSHTVNHTPNLANCDAPLYEVAESKRMIESWGIPCKYLIYPNGVVTDEVLLYINQYYDYGFLAGGTQKNGIHIQNRVNYYPLDNYQVKRTALNGSMSVEEQNFIKTQIDEDLNAYSDIVSYIRNLGYDIESLDTVIERFQ